MKTLRLLLTLCLLTVGTGFVRAQSIEELNARIRQAEAEIARNNELLRQYRNDKQINQRQLKLIGSRITTRLRIVSSLNEQIVLINEDINKKNNQIDTLGKELAALRREYAGMIRETYKNYKLDNALMFLFAARDFNDAVLRVNLMRRLNVARERKAERIDSLTQALGNEIAVLDSRRTQLDSTRSSRTREVEKLGRDQRSYRSAITRIERNEAGVNRKIKAKEAEKQKAQRQIERIVAEEARRARNAKRSTAERQYDVKLTGAFGQNKGKLPAPVEGGVVIDRWGIHNHPTQAGMKINNKGVNYAAARGAAVHCVFEGVVTRILFIPGLNNSVMVRHGNYITVYSNLASVQVKKDQPVVLGQILGTLSDGNDPEEYMLHFELWNETTNLNPQLWIKP